MKTLHQVLLDLAEQVNNSPDFNWEKHIIPGTEAQIESAIGDIICPKGQVIPYKNDDQREMIERLLPEQLARLQTFLGQGDKGGKDE